MLDRDLLFVLSVMVKAQELDQTCNRAMAASVVSDLEEGFILPVSVSLNDLVSSYVLYQYGLEGDKPDWLV